MALVVPACGGRARPSPASPTPASPAIAIATAPPPSAIAPTPTPAPTPAPPDPLAGQIEAVVRGYEDAARAAGPEAPCPAVAVAISSAAEANRGDRAEIRAAARGPRAAEVDAMLTTAAARIAPAVATLDAAGQRCRDQAAVGAALDALSR